MEKESGICRRPESYRIYERIIGEKGMRLHAFFTEFYLTDIFSFVTIHSKMLGKEIDRGTMSDGDSSNENKPPSCYMLLVIGHSLILRE